MAKKKNYNIDKKSDASRKAKPSGYRYIVGDDKEHPLYYKRPSAEEIKKYLAGDKKMKNKIYFEGRSHRSDSSQTKKLAKGGKIIKAFVYKKSPDGATVDGYKLVYEISSRMMGGDGVVGTIRTAPQNYLVAIIDSDGGISFEDMDAMTKDIDKEKVVKLWNTKQIPAIDNYTYPNGKNNTRGFAYDKGGTIPDNYEGKGAKEVWDAWDVHQRIHFIVDHTRKQHTPVSQEEISKKAYNFLPTDIKKELKKHVEFGQYKKGGAIKSKKDKTLYVAISETEGGYWVILSKPTTKEIAEQHKTSALEGEVGKVVTLEEAKAHKKVVGDEYLEMEEGGEIKKEGGEVTGKTKTIHGISHSIMRKPADYAGMLKIEDSHPLGVIYSDGKYGYVEDKDECLRFDIIDLDDIKKKMKDGGTMTMDAHGVAVTIVDASNMSHEDIVKKELKEVGKIQKSFLRQLLGRELNYHETVGSVKLRKPHMCSYFVEVN